MKNTDYRDGLHLVVAGQILSEMELSDMMRRQSRRTPTPLLSTENDGEVADGSGRREKVGLQRSWLWGEMGV